MKKNKTKSILACAVLASVLGTGLWLPNSAFAGKTTTITSDATYGTGSVFLYGYENAPADQLTDNKLLIQGGTFSSNGYSSTNFYGVSSGVGGTFSKNLVKISGGTFTERKDTRVYGAYGCDTSTSGTLDENIVEFSGGTFTDCTIKAYGVYADYKNFAPIKNNKVIFSGANFTRGSCQVYGGYTNANQKDSKNEISGNTVEISGGEFTSITGAFDVYGGYDSSGGYGSKAFNNTVKISGGTFTDCSRIWLSGGRADAVYDNKLVIGTKSVSVKTIEKFDKIEFSLPVGIANDDTMLTVENMNFYKYGDNGNELILSVSKDVQLKKGTIITLINATNIDGDKGSVSLNLAGIASDKQSDYVSVTQSGNVISLKMLKNLNYGVLWYKIGQTDDGEIYIDEESNELQSINISTSDIKGDVVISRGTKTDNMYGTINATSSYTVTNSSDKQLWVTGDLTAKSVTNSKSLMIGASNLKSPVTNTDGEIILMDGTLEDYTITDGTISIFGAVTANAKNLASKSGIINDMGRFLTLNGGDIRDNIKSSGSLTIDGDVTNNSNKTITQNALTINSNKSFSTEVDKLNISNNSGTITNNGTLTLTGDNSDGDTLQEAVSGAYNEGILNFNGDKKITATGAITQNEVNVNTDLVMNNTLTAGKVTIAEGKTLTMASGKSLTANSSINEGNLVIGAGDLKGDVLNLGTVKLNGTDATLQQVISGKGNVTIDGTVKSALSNLTNTGNLTVNSEKVLELTDGTLARNIAGAGTVKLGGKMTVLTDQSIAGILDGNGKTLTMTGGAAGSAINTLTVGTLKGNLNLELDVDMSISAPTADMIKATTVDSTTAINIKSINITKDRAVGTPPSVTELPQQGDVGTAIVFLTENGGAPTKGTYKVNNPAGAATGYTEADKILLTTTNEHTYKFNVGKTNGTINCVEVFDPLTLKEFLEGTKYTEGDVGTLSLTADCTGDKGYEDNAANMDVATQSNTELNINLNGYTLSKKTDVMTVTTGEKALNINGGNRTVEGGGAVAGTTDLNFVVSAAVTESPAKNAGTLNISGNIKLTGNIVNGGDVTFAGTTEATGTLSGAGSYINSGTLTIADAAKLTMTDGLKNTGTLNLGGESSSVLGAVIKDDTTATGTTNIKGDVSSAFAITQSAINIADGKKLTMTADLTATTVTVGDDSGLIIGASNLKADVTNGGTVTLNAGTLADDYTITGGKITIGGAVSAAVTDLLSTGGITNASSTLTITGEGELQDNISGDGTTVISGTITSAKTIANGVTNNGTFTITDGGVTGAITNSGTLNVGGGTINSNITNSATLNISGGTVDTVTNTGTMNVTDVSALTDAVTNTDGTVNFDEADATLNEGVTVTGGTINVKQNLTATVTDLASTSGINNKATLTLTGTGAIQDNINNLDSTAGTTVINGTITNTNNKTITQGALTVAEGGTLTTEVDALHIGTNDAGPIVNDGTLTLTGDGTTDILQEAVSGSEGKGTLNFNGEKKITATGVISQNAVNVNTDLGMNNTLTAGKVTIAEGKTLTMATGKDLTVSTVTNGIANSGTLVVDAGNLKGDVTSTDGGNVTLNTGTLTSGSTITGGKITINGNVTAQVTDLKSTQGIGNVTATNTLTITGEGALNDNISGGGKTVINGVITSAKTVANAVTINADKKLTNTGAISGAVTNEGTFITTANGITGGVKNTVALELTGGDLGSVITDGETLSGTTTINGEVTNSNKYGITQKDLAINEGKSLNTEVDVLHIGTDDAGPIKNNGTLTLVTDGSDNDTLQEAITGETGKGSLVIDGAVIATNDITQNALTINNGKSLNMSTADKKLTVATAIDNKGTLTIGASDLKSSVTNAGETAQVNLGAGTLAGTTVLKNGVVNLQGEVKAKAGNFGTGDDKVDTLKFDTDSFLDIVNNSTGDAADAYDSIAVGTLSGSGILSFDIDLSQLSGDEKSLTTGDKFTVGSVAADTTITLKNIHITGVLEAEAVVGSEWEAGTKKTYTLFKGATDNVTDNLTMTIDTTGTDTLTSKGYRYEFAQNDTKKGDLDVTRYHSEKGLQGVVQGVNDVDDYNLSQIATYSLVTDYNETNDLGTLGSNTTRANKPLTIDGNGHVFGGNSHTGITLQNSGDTLNLKDIKEISGWNDYVVKNGTGGTVNIKAIDDDQATADVVESTVLNSKMTGEGTYNLLSGILTVADAGNLAMTTLDNAATLNLGGDTASALGANITGTSGTVNINGVVTSDKTIANAVNINSGKQFTNTGTISGAVDNGGTFTTTANGITGGVKNTGSLTLTGGTAEIPAVLASVISDETTPTGTVTVSGSVTNTNNKSITQKNLTIAEGGSLTTAVDKLVIGIDGKGSITVAGTLNLQGGASTGKTLSQVLTGTGKLVVSGGDATTPFTVTTGKVIDMSGDVEVQSNNTLVIDNTKFVANNLTGGGLICVDPSYVQLNGVNGEETTVIGSKLDIITDGSVVNVGNTINNEKTAYTFEELKNAVTYEDLNMGIAATDFEETNDRLVMTNTEKKLGLLALKGHVDLGEAGGLAITNEKDTTSTAQINLQGDNALLVVDRSIAFNDADCVDDVEIFKTNNADFIPKVAIVGVDGTVTIDKTKTKLFITGIDRDVDGDGEGDAGVGIYAIMQGTGIDGSQYFDIDNDMVMQDGGDTYRIVELDEQERADLNAYLTGGAANQKIYAVRVDWNKVEKIFTGGPINGQEAWNNMLQNDDKHTPGKEWLLKVIKGTKQDREVGRSALNQVASLAQDLGVERGAYDVTNMVGSAIDKHWDDNRVQDSGVRSQEKRKVWASYIRNKDEIDSLKTNGMDAQYTAQYNGAVVGVDITKGFGLALAYADGDIHNTFSGRNEADYYGGSMYFHRQVGNFAVGFDATYLNGSNELTQTIYGTEMTGKAKTDTISGGLTAKYLAKAGKFGDVGFFTSARYMHINSRKFSDNLGISHEAEKINSVVVPVGLEYNGAFKMKGSDWTWKPRLAAGYLFNLGDRDNYMVMNYRGVADSFLYDFVDKGAFFANAGMVFEKKNFSLGISYDFMKSKNSKNRRWNVNADVAF